MAKFFKAIEKHNMQKQQASALTQQLRHLPKHSLKI
jgi:hypothetical protein